MNAGIRTIYVVISIFIAVAILALTHSITRRILLLKGQMMQIQKGIIGKVEVKEKYNDEIGQMITHYNEMVGKVEELMQEQVFSWPEKDQGGAEGTAVTEQSAFSLQYTGYD